MTTHWTVVRAAGCGTSVDSRHALETLCVGYWQPLYYYVRRKGFSEVDAQDLTQEFFARLIQRNDFAVVTPEAGRFRAFLLAALNHFLANEWRRATAEKRGGGQVVLPLDTALAEQHYGADHTSACSPEKLFDRRWAETVLGRAAQALKEEFVVEGKANLFGELNVYLSTPPAPGEYASLAQRLGLSEAALAKSVERLRRRYRELVRREIAETVDTPAQVDEEMRYLLEVMT